MPEDAADEDCLRAGCRAFLRFLADEPAFARVFYIEMPTAGTHSVERLHASASRYTEINAKWHRRARVRHPDWPEVPDEAYQALAGACAELVRSWVSAGKTEALGNSRTYSSPSTWPYSRAAPGRPRRTDVATLEDRDWLHR